MDTRNKILKSAEGVHGPLVLAVGTFNPLRAAHARELQHAEHEKLLVIVLPCDPELLPQSARVELVAALRSVDYVIAAERPEPLIEQLQPSRIIHLELEDAARTSQLIERVNSGHTK